MPTYLTGFIGTFFLMLTIGSTVLPPNDAGAAAGATAAGFLKGFPAATPLQVDPTYALVGEFLSRSRCAPWC